MRAIILAGGKGKRLFPLTKIFPKPMIPIGEKPIAEIIIGQLVSFGFHDIIMSVGYLSELIRTYFNGRYNNGVRLSYVDEEKPMGTAGCLAAVPRPSGPSLVINGDVLTGLNFRELMAYHNRNNALVTIAVAPKQVKVEFGVIKSDEKNAIISYNEKPVLPYHASAGVYVCSPGVWNYIKPNEYLDFPTLVQRLLSANESVFAYPYDGYWRDVGTHDEYELAVEDFENQREIFAPDFDKAKV